MDEKIHRDSPADSAHPPDGSTGVSVAPTPAENQQKNGSRPGEDPPHSPEHPDQSASKMLQAPIPSSSSSYQPINGTGTLRMKAPKEIQKMIENFVLPEDYSAYPLPKGSRSFIYLYGKRAVDNTTGKSKWFCLASEQCRVNKTVIATTTNISSVTRHLQLTHDLSSPKTESSRRKFIDKIKTSIPESLHGNAIQRSSSKRLRIDNEGDSDGEGEIQEDCEYDEDGEEEEEEENNRYKSHKHDSEYQSSNCGTASMAVKKGKKRNAFALEERLVVAKERKVELLELRLALDFCTREPPTEEGKLQLYEKLGRILHSKLSSEVQQEIISGHSRDMVI